MLTRATSVKVRVFNKYLTRATSMLIVVNDFSAL